MRCKLCGGETDVLHDGVCFECAATPKTARISAQWVDASPAPKESTETEWLFQWAKDMSVKYPELESMYHITNEGKRSRIAGARLKKQGLKKGMLDLCLPCARCGCHALYIEMKRVKDGRPSKQQLEWIDRLTRQGNMALVCEGWRQAADVIERYLEGRI